MMSFDYTLYGLRVQSALHLPEISGSELIEDGSPGVVIDIGHVPDALDGGRRVAPFMEVTRRACLYRFEDVGAYLVEGGDRIVVDPLPSAAPNDVRAYLFGSVMGTLLHQRGLVPLHISAVMSPKGVIAFTGPSGVGKSTTASLVHRETGWPILCDDVAAVRMINDQPILSAGLVRLKLWKDALEAFGIEEEGLDRDLVRQDKFHLSAPEMFAGDGLALGRLVVLGRGAEKGVLPLSGARAFAEVLNAVYRPYLADLFWDRGAMNQICGEVAKAVDVVRINRNQTGLLASW